MKEFLIAYENGSDSCTLYVDINRRHMSDYRLTREELEQLKVAIDNVLKLWKQKIYN